MSKQTTETNMNMNKNNNNNNNNNNSSLPHSFYQADLSIGMLGHVAHGKVIKRLFHMGVCLSFCYNHVCMTLNEICVFEKTWFLTKILQSQSVDACQSSYW